MALSKADTRTMAGFFMKIPEKASTILSMIQSMTFTNGIPGRTSGLNAFNLLELP